MAEPARSDPGAAGGPAARDAELAALVGRLREQGDADLDRLAEDLIALEDRRADEADALKRRLIETLSINHDINNALVGIVGNAQLLGLGPAAALPGVKDRLDVIQHESKRIKLAAARLSELKHALLVDGHGHGGPTR